SLSATNRTGTLQTAAQPNITSTGNLTLPGSLTITNGSSPFTCTNTTLSSTVVCTIQNSGGAIDIGSSTSHQVAIKTANTRRLTLYAFGNVDVVAHNGSTVGLKLGGTLVTATAADLNGISVTPGTVSASKPVVIDSSKNVTGLGRLNLTSSDATVMTGTTNASSFGLNILSTVATNGQYNICAIGFRNAVADGVAHSVILCERKSSTTAYLVFLNQGASNISECMRILSTGGCCVNAAPIAQLSVGGSASYVDGSYQRLLDLQSNNVSPIEFTVEVNSGANTTTTNTTFLVNITNIDLRFGVNNNTKMILDTNGRLGIGTTSPEKFLHVNGTVSNTFNVGGCLYSQTTSTASTFSQLGPVTVSVSAMFSGPIECLSIYCTSDRRAKENIERLDESYCDNFFKADVYMYNYIGSKETIPKIGFIAQDISKLGYMNLLTLTPNDNMKKVNDDDVEGAQMNIDYNKITAINFLMIKKLMRQIEELESEVNRLTI
ncbi:TPA: hypothetical protein N0F65_007353, partial [Lagenidium giganteum]